jgi:F-type H+-transporting ATPase subunit b
MYLADVSAGLLDLSASFLAEVIAFLAMILILGKWVYPWVMLRAEERQQAISAELEAAERSRQDAEERLKQAEAQLQAARGQAAVLIEGAGRSAEQLRAEMQSRAREEARQIAESAKRDIEAERLRAIDSVRGEVADLVVAATEKVVGESLDDQRHRRLIADAINQVGAAVGKDGKN